MKHYFYLYFLLVCVLGEAYSQTPSANENYIQVQTYRGTAASQPVTTIQYVDGLGRPMQTVIHKGSPTQKDVIEKHLSYDAQGRPSKNYLPTPDSASSGGFSSTVVAQASSFYGDTRPFSAPVYEASALNRVLEQYGAGQNWHTANRSVKTSYQVNGASEVRRWQVGSSVYSGDLYSSGFYAEGDLYKTIVTDEENHQMIEYKDTEGMVVEKWVQDGGTLSSPTWLVTSYIYDSMNRLRYVVQPALHQRKVAAGVGVLTLSEQTDLEDLFIYRYDKRKRVIEKHVPAGGWSYFVYNRMGQVILSQNARQREEDQWTFTKYDALGRVVLSGEKVFSGQSRQALQDSAEQLYTDPAEGEEIGQPIAHYEVRSASDSIWEYSNGAFPSVSKADVHVVNYYDDYSWNKGTLNFVPFESLTQQPARGMATGSKVRLLDGSGTMLSSVFYYDTKNRVVQTHQQNPFGGVCRTDLTLSFAGEVLKKRVVNSYTDGKPSYTTLTQYSYDHVGRKTKTRHAVLKAGESEESAQGVTLAEYIYDEIGRLKAKRIQPAENGYESLEGSITPQVRRNGLISGNVSDKATTEIILGEGFAMSEGSTYVGQVVPIPLGGGELVEALQVINYDYNIRGWLTGINQGTLNKADNDLFGMKLHYEDQPGGYYNGNIHKQSWMSHSVKDSPARGYTYSYDAANRITAAQYFGGKYAGENYSLSGMQYDKNGNIMALTRSGMKAGSPTAPTQFGVIDQLSYRYQPNSNKLAAVTDDMTTLIPDVVGDFRDKNTAGDDYDYYADGSLKTDKNKGITTIKYNYLGLVDTVVVSEGQNQGTINYVYDGSGRKWRKVVYDQVKLTTAKTDYDQAMQFEDNKLSFILHEEGRVIPEPQTGKLVYEYHYRDQLGNLRVAFRQRSQAQTNARLSMEPVLAASEEASFEHVDENRAAGVAHSGNYSARVKQGVGPAKQVQLEAGEKLQVKVFGHVEAEGKHKISFLPLPIVGDVPAGGENGKRKLVVKGGMAVPLNWGSKNANQPAAYLEIVATDTSGKVVHSERKSLTHAATDSWEELSLAYQAQSKETVVIQLVNPSEIAIVHFDDMSISQEPPLIVQENHYDPWGLNLVGIEVEGNPEHKYQYNGKERQDELGLHWNDHGARMYDVQLGRWHAVDPLADLMASSTPYHYTHNNPLKFVDPSGLAPVYSNGAYYESNGDEVSWEYVQNWLKETGGIAKTYKPLTQDRLYPIAESAGYTGRNGSAREKQSFIANVGNAFDRLARTAFGIDQKKHLWSSSARSTQTAGRKNYVEPDSYGYVEINDGTIRSRLFPKFGHFVEIVEDFTQLEMMEFKASGKASIPLSYDDYQILGELDVLNRTAAGLESKALLTFITLAGTNIGKSVLNKAYEYKVAIYQIIALEEYIDGKPSGNISFSASYPILNPQSTQRIQLPSVFTLSTNAIPLPAPK